MIKLEEMPYRKKKKDTGKERTGRVREIRSPREEERLLVHLANSPRRQRRKMFHY